MNKKYQHIFFDLDRTLWDFETSALQAFDVIFDKYELSKLGVKSGKDFHEAYTIHNNRLWELYRNGEIKKEYLKAQRFHLTLLEFQVDDRDLAEKIGEDYTSISPRLVNLFPNAIEVLEYLSKDYDLHIITNGFKEVQTVKLASSGMDKFFNKVVTSEEAGVKKPDIKIFKYALEKAGANSGNSIMIGDDYEVDIVGAQNVGLDQAYFNPNGLESRNNCTFEISDLIELKEKL